MSNLVFPSWLHAVAVLSLVIGGACALVIAADEAGRTQRMWIMNIVWPLTALFGGVLWLVLYWRFGRGSSSKPAQSGQGQKKQEEVPIWASVAKAASHCGAGCTLGDIIAEWLAYAVPGVAIALGWGALFGEKMFAVWILDFLLAFLLGIGFQYFTIKPMRDLSVKQGFWQAAKADTASITAWQVGMYGAMAALQFLWFRRAYGGTAPVDTPEFWFAMQLAMLAGFCTAFPVNWLLVRTGVKERM